MRVLLTGGHGFVGSHLVRRLLDAGHRVRCLVRHPGRPASLAGLDVEVARGDVRDRAALAGALQDVDQVHHLAALTRSRTRREILETNVGGTRRLLDAACRQGGVERFVLCSSLAAVGPAPEGRAVDEEAPCRPVTWYGESKCRAEDVVRAAADRIPVTIVRPPAVYGPRDRDFLPVFRAAAQGLVPTLSEPRHYHFVYVEDLAAALAIAGTSPATVGGTYHAAHPRVRTPDELALYAAQALGRRIRFLRLPFSLLGLLCRLGDLGTQLRGEVPLLNGQRRLELSGRAYLCSSARLARATGWRAATDVPVGAARTVAWYVAQGWIRPTANPPPLVDGGTRGPENRASPREG